MKDVNKKNEIKPQHKVDKRAGTGPPEQDVTGVGYGKCVNRVPDREGVRNRGDGERILGRSLERQIGTPPR